MNASVEWSSIVPTRRMTHPVLRLDARWKCKVCNQVEHKYDVDGCLCWSMSSLMCRGGQEQEEKGGSNSCLECNSFYSTWAGNQFPFTRPGDLSYQLTNMTRLLLSWSSVYSVLELIMKEKLWKPRNSLMQHYGIVCPINCLSIYVPNLLWASLHLMLNPWPISDKVGHSHRHASLMQVEIISEVAPSVMNPQLNLFGLARYANLYRHKIFQVRDEDFWCHKHIVSFSL